MIQKAVKTAANITSTLLVHHVADKLETILDREAKISHEAFSAQIENRLGDGESKGPDMRVWSKGRGLNEVAISQLACITSLKCIFVTGRLVFY